MLCGLLKGIIYELNLEYHVLYKEHIGGFLYKINAVYFTTQNQVRCLVTFKNSCAKLPFI